MTDLQVIYDPALEAAAIIDLDTRTAVGPAEVGANAQTLLEAFAATIPYDITGLHPALVVAWYVQFRESTVGQAAAQAAENSSVTVGEPSSTDVGTVTPTTPTPPTGGDEPPPPQPADTDLGGNPGATATVAETPEVQAERQTGEEQQGGQYTGQCFACSGTGTVPGSEPGSQLPCNLCKGTGHLPAPA